MNIFKKNEGVIFAIVALLVSFGGAGMIGHQKKTNREKERKETELRELCLKTKPYSSNGTTIWVLPTECVQYIKLEK